MGECQPVRVRWRCGRWWAGCGAGVARVGGQVPHGGAVSPELVPRYSAKPAQPMRSLSKPANMHASCVIVSGSRS